MIIVYHSRAYLRNSVRKEAPRPGTPQVVGLSLNNASDIGIDADRSVFDLLGAHCLAVVDAYIRYVFFVHFWRIFAHFWLENGQIIEHYIVIKRRKKP